MNKTIQNISGAFLQEIKAIIGGARVQAVRSVEFYRVEMYWKLGERIFVEEQQGKERADYGSYLIRRLAEELAPEFGSGFSVRTLEQARQFYRIFPIANALRSQLNWMQYRMLIQIENASKREYYELLIDFKWFYRTCELYGLRNGLIFIKHPQCRASYPGSLIVEIECNTIRFD